MSPKAAAAIGLTLALTIPIILGYALNVHEEERTGWQSENAINVTDMMLNHSTPYYMVSTAPGNNAELYAITNYPGAGVTTTSIISPSYINQGTNYSSLPIYSTSTAAYALEAITTMTTVGHNTGTYSYINYGGDIPAGKGYYYFQSSQLAEARGARGTDLNTTFGPFLQTANNYWSWNTTGDRPIDMDTTFQIVSDRSPTYTIISRPWTDLNINTDYNVSFAGPAAIKLTDSFGNITYAESRPSATTSILKNGTSVVINNYTEYSNISAVAIAPGPAAGNSVNYTYTTTTDTYGNAAYGWAVPSPGAGAVQQAYWMNGQVNTTVRMMMALDNGEWADLQAVASNGALSSNIEIVRNSSNITVNGQSLGNYQYLCLEWAKDSVTVSGIAAWPTMGISPVLINSITINYTAALDDIVRIHLSGPADTVRYRVDNAEILAGTFPSTMNYNLNMAEYWPGKSYGVSFTSIGVYGDYLTFGGQQFDITDGSITIGDKKIRLLKSVFNSTYNGSIWTNSINGYEISTGSPSPLFFGGEWSATVSAFSLEQITGTTLEWEAGGFDFDLNRFALAGLLTCGALFIGLAAYGAKSGAKVLWLLMILGGLSIVFMIMI